MLQSEFHPEAQEEYLAAIRWYGDKESGLGSIFQQSVERMILSLRKWPESSPVWPGWDRLPIVHAAHLPGSWPFRIVYFVQGDNLVVVAVAHDKRVPGYWQDRVPQ